MRAGEISADRGGGCIRTERIKTAMRDVEDFHHAVGQRQAQRDDEKPRKIGRAVDEDGEKPLHRQANGREGVNAGVFS
jgi:hypothetical protein